MIFARIGDKKQTRRQNMAEIVFSWGVSEIKCTIFRVKKDNPCEMYNNRIKLSIVLTPMIISSQIQVWHICHVDRHGHFTLKQLRLPVLNETHTNSYAAPRQHVKVF